MSIDNTLAERGARYGDFTEHAEVTQAVKDAMKNSVNWSRLAPDMTEALEMVAHKIGRILNGDPNYIDSWTDIIGYTRLVEKRLIDEQKDEEPTAGLDAKTEDALFDGTLLRVLKEAFGPDVQIRRVE